MVPPTENDTVEEPPPGGKERVDHTSDFWVFLGRGAADRLVFVSLVTALLRPSRIKNHGITENKGAVRQAAPQKMQYCRQIPKRRGDDVL